MDELNIKNLEWEKAKELTISIDLNLDSELITEGQLRELIRQVQDARKTIGARLDQHIILTAPLPSKPEHLTQLIRKTLAQKVLVGDTIRVELI